MKLNMSFFFNFELSEEDCESSNIQNSDRESDLINTKGSHTEDQKNENISKSVELPPASEITEFCSDSIISKLDMKTLEFGDVCLTFVDTSSMEQKLLSDSEISYGMLQSSGGAVHDAVISHSDLVTGVYEGGMKIWECGMDLVEFLSSHPVGVAVNFKGKSVLELGCGAGLPGLYCYKFGARQVHFQDYNEEVLKLLTHTNVVSNEIVMDGSPPQCRYFSGDWSSFCLIAVRENLRYDVILTAETIYNTDNYSKLHDVFKTTLADDGLVFLAAKSYYFGVGGSVDSFMEYVRSQDYFSIDILHSVGKGVQRQILLLRCLKENSADLVRDEKMNT